MRKKEEKFWPKKLLDYAVKIDLIWLVIWGTIFISFVVLDSIFQTAYPGENVFYELDLGVKHVVIKVVENGTFIGTTLLKYIGIILSFIYARKKFPKDYILQIALAFTLLADTILTFDQVSRFGVLAFCFAQYFHLARFAKIKPKYFVGYTLMMLLVLIFANLAKIEDMYALAFIYAFSLGGNLYLTHQWWTKVKAKRPKTFIPKTEREKYDRELVASTCAFWGFFFFILCDMNVALSYLSVTGTITPEIARYANFFAWLFYYPSQVLISNSSVITERPISKKSLKKVHVLK